MIHCHLSTCIQNSIFIFEVGYFLDVFQNLWFDTIYHEHLDYHTVAPLKKFFKSIGMELFDTKRIDIQGGSIRNFIQLSGGQHQKSSSIEELILLEKQKGLTNISDLKSFQSRIDSVKDNLSQLLKDIKRILNKVHESTPKKKISVIFFHLLLMELVFYGPTKGPVF